jgi:hypothetical protein
MGINKKNRHATTDGKALKDALIVLARSGLSRPGTNDGEVSYVPHLNREGALQAVDVVMTDECLGNVLDVFTTEPRES